ncbi:MAG: CARDB domain-containing protein [Cyclobacteriaceae bacterium]
MKKILTISVLVFGYFHSQSQIDDPADFQVTVYHDKVVLSFVDNSTGEEEFQIRNRPNISRFPWSSFKNLSAQAGTISNHLTINLTEFRDAETALKRFRIRAVKKNFLGIVSQSSNWIYKNPVFIIPNMLVENVSANYSECEVGVFYRVKNTGNYASKACQGVITVGSMQKTISIPSLQPGELKYMSTSIDRDGSSLYNVNAVVTVDTSNDNYETTNSDNTASSSGMTFFSSTTCDPQNQQIDLTIASPAIASQGVQSIDEKSSFSSSFVVYNLKPDLAPASTVKIYWNTSSSLSGATLTKTVSIPAINGGNISGSSNSGNVGFTVTT